MTLPPWTIKLAAAAVIPMLLGVGVAMSAPSRMAVDQEFVPDDAYQPGEFGVDFAAVTGPVGPSTGKKQACEAAVWPRIPAECIKGEADDEGVRIVR